MARVPPSALPRVSHTKLSQLEPDLPAAGEIWEGPIVSPTSSVPGMMVDEPDSYIQGSAYDGGYAYDPAWNEEVWDWHLLPSGLIYQSYLAGVHEPRFASVWNYDKDRGWYWDSTLGGRVGLLRYGTASNNRPQGWQLDIEGAAMPRLTLEDGLRDLESADFRAGVPLTYGEGDFQFKFAYYHLSSHLGDEYMLRNPMGYRRINYTRDALVFGTSYYMYPTLRLYGEASYAFGADGGAQPWEFQFGFDHAPAMPTGCKGAPFVAANVHLREDVDFGGNFVFQTGWAWRGPCSSRLLRVGVQYYNGKSQQYEFFDQFEEQFGIGMWFDY